jgi:hypothetical protein
MPTTCCQPSLNPLRSKFSLSSAKWRITRANLP